MNKLLKIMNNEKLTIKNAVAWLRAMFGFVGADNIRPHVDKHTTVGSCFNGHGRMLSAPTILLLMVMLCSEPAYAAGCNVPAAAGETFTATNGTGTFCRSTAEMNWWSAYSWCKAQGLEMATPADIGCTGISATANTLTCSAFQAVSIYYWLNASSSNSSRAAAWTVNSSTGGTNAVYQRNGSAAPFRALCL